MLTKNPIGKHDPARLVRLEAIRPLFMQDRRIEVGETFEVEARQCAEILTTGRAKFANEHDRGLVYRVSEVF